MEQHQPECTVPWMRECICAELQMAYDRAVLDCCMVIIGRISDLLNCGKDDNCETMSVGADLVLDDIRWHLQGGKEEYENERQQ